MTTTIPDRPIPGDVNQIGVYRGRKSSKHRRGQAIGKRETRSPHGDWHDLRQKNDHGTIVAAEDERQPLQWRAVRFAERLRLACHSRMGEWRSHPSSSSSWIRCPHLNSRKRRTRNGSTRRQNDGGISAPNCGARDRNRTGTELSPLGILSPTRSFPKTRNCRQLQRLTNVAELRSVTFGDLLLLTERQSFVRVRANGHLESSQVPVFFLPIAESVSSGKSGEGCFPVQLTPKHKTTDRSSTVTAPRKVCGRFKTTFLQSNKRGGQCRRILGNYPCLTAWPGNGHLVDDAIAANVPVQ